MAESNIYEQMAKANSVFTPGYPVRQKDLFSGRTQQLQRIVEALTAPGRHPVIFGQRGVGKTSLANILGEAVRGIVAIKVSCDGADNFPSIWNRVLANASMTFKQKAFGFTGEESKKIITLGEALGHDASTAKAAEIAELLRKVPQYCVVILDEFDKVADQNTKAIFADLIKILSDTAALVTMVVVGVADNVHELIGEHPSIERNLLQVELPLMSDAEIKSIVETGLQRLGIRAQPGTLDQIPVLAGGYPHYAHLLGLCAAKACFENEQRELSQELFDLACNLAVQDAVEKYRDAYARATATTQLSRYPMILSACGYARTDERGVFRATDVVDAITEVFNERLPIQAIVPALGQFLNRDRAQVLRAVQVSGRQCYRFTDPMMRPYCRLKARDLLRGG